MANITVQPSVQVLVDWTNNPIGSGATAGSNFVDISSSVRLDQPLTIARGRQDNISSVQPSRANLTVDNSTGNFTPGHSGSAYFPGVLLGRRIQINVKDEGGTYHTRFDGQIAEIDVDDTPTGRGTTATLICADVIAYLNRYPEMSCWTVEYSQSVGNLLLQYPMNDPEGSQGISDLTGNGNLLPLYTYASPQNATPIGTAYTVTAPTAAYQSGTNPVEGAAEPTVQLATNQAVTSPISSPLPSVQFGGTISSSGSVTAPWGCSAQFQGNMPSPVTVTSGNAYTLVCWVWPNVTLSNLWNLAYNQEVLTIGNTRTGQMLGLECSTIGSVNTMGEYYAAYYPNFLQTTAGSSRSNAIDGGGEWFNGPVMLAAVINGTTCTLYVGGNLWGIGQTLIAATTTVTIPTGTVFNYLTVGGALGGGNGFLGNISNVCVYSGALSTTVLNNLGGMGAWGPSLLAPGAAVQDLLNITGVPSYWTGTMDHGSLLQDWFDLTGSQPFTAIQTIQQAELGLAFTDASGKLQFHSRDRRMGTGAPITTLPAGSYNPGIAPKWNDQLLVNSSALQNERQGLPVVSENTTSIAQYGLYPSGSTQAPTIIPAFTWTTTISLKQVSAPGTYQPFQEYDNTPLQDIADWTVNTASQPGMKLATTNVDMLSNKSGQNEYVAPSTLYGIEIDSVISLGQNLPWWPNSTEASELFVEGVNETYSLTEATISFYTSPAFISRGWVPASTSYGQLDVSARVGVANPITVGPFTSPPSITTFSTTMNNSDGGATSNGYVSVRDLRGIFGNLQLMQQPPLLYTEQTTTAQSIANNTTTFIVWDGTLVDTTSAMNQYTNGAEAVITWQEGWYEIYATVQFAASAAGNRTIWIAQNQTLAGNRVVAPASTRGSGSAPTGLTTSCVIFCQSGDAIAVKVEQDSGGALSTSLTNGGSQLSLRYVGYSASNRN